MWKTIRLDKTLKPGETALLLVAGVDKDELNARNLPGSYGYCVVMLEKETEFFPGALYFERDTLVELRDGISEFLEANR